MSKLTTTEKAARNEHFAKFADCWMCHFLNRKQSSNTELHHIAGRGKNHEVRENYASLCRECHAAIQSRHGAELACLALKYRCDFDHYEPSVICRLRGRANTCWTHTDVLATDETMRLMRELFRE